MDKDAFETRLIVLSTFWKNWSYFISFETLCS